MPTATHAVLMDEAPPRMLDRLAPLTEALTSPRALPMAFVSTDQRRAEQIARVPGVLDIREIDSLTARLVGGIDATVSTATELTSLVGPNGVDERATDQRLGYPVLDKESLEPTLDPAVELPTRLGVLCALNLSWGIGPSDRYDPADPLVVATRWAAERTPVVMAAGNWYQDRAAETLSAWAESPWVIAVGATDAADGGGLMDLSSAGVAGNPRSGPDVASFGASLLDPERRGTSYAAPRVTRSLVQLGAWTLTLRHVAALHRGGVLEGIPVASFAIVDQDIDLSEITPRVRLEALPNAGVDADALGAILDLADGYGLDVELWPTPLRLRQMLEQSARELPGLGRHEVGAGFVSDTIIAEYLRDFDGADLLTTFADPLRASPAVLAEAGELKLAVGSHIDALCGLWAGAARRWMVDVAA